MNRLFVTTLMAAVILPFTARAQSKTEFSGTWVLDAARSQSPPGRGGARGEDLGHMILVIKQTSTELSVETKRGENSQTATYRLDGSESTNQMTGRGGRTTATSKSALGRGQAHRRDEP